MTRQEGLPELASPKQIAEYMGTTEASLAHDRYMRRGLPYTRIGRRIRYMRADVLKHLEDNRIGGGTAAAQ